MINCRTPPKGDLWRKDWREWGVLASSTQQRRAVVARDHGRCASCGELVTCWEADHIVALHSIPPSQLEYPACLKFWALGNLQTLGVSCGCHKKKSALEAKNRAKVNRIVKKGGLLVTSKDKKTPFRATGRPPKRKISADMAKKQSKFKDKMREKAKQWRKMRRVMQKGHVFIQKSTLRIP